MNHVPELLKKSGFAVFIILIILLSFRLFSTIFYPLVNADEGVVVLMLHYFKFPDDLYFWGQDRYGSIVPLLGQIPYKILGFSSLASESVTHYIILIAGYLAFSTFIKSKTNKILFAVVWFLPPLYYTDLLRNVFGLQYSITGILFFLLFRHLPSYQTQSLSKKLPFYLLILLVTFTAFWVSDLAITSVSALLIVNLILVIKEKNVKTVFRKSETYFWMTGLFLTYLFINYLKSHAETSHYDQYGNKLINDFPDVINSITLLFSSIRSILTFRVPDFLFSVYAYLIIIIPLLIFIHIKKINIEKKELRWVTIFFLDGLILLAVILVSNWALSNGMPRRYFVGAHISFWLAFLILFSNFTPGRIKTVISVLAFLAAGIGAVSTVYSYRYINPKSFKPKAGLVREFTQLGKTGIISDYWNSYGSSFADPDMIKATPYEQSYSVRNPDLIDSVFAQPKIILVKDMWLDDFPDTIVQFDRTLIRKDSSFFMGGCHVCEYTVRRNWIFNIKDLKQQAGLVSFEKSLDKEVLKIGEGYEASIYKHVVYGPFITLLKGRYEVSFDIRFDSVFTAKNIAELDVASDYGNTKRASLILKPSLIPSMNAFHEYKLEFNIEEKNSTIEFRIYYLGGAYLTFDRVRLRQVDR